MGSALEQGKSIRDGTSAAAPGDVNIMGSCAAAFQKGVDADGDSKHANKELAEAKLGKDDSIDEEVAAVDNEHKAPKERKEDKEPKEPKEPKEHKEHKEHKGRKEDGR